MAKPTDARREILLVLEAQSGSQEALNEIFKSVQEPLFNYILTLVRERHLAEDVLQEVFLRIYRKLRWLQEPAAFRAWSYQIATREAFRQLKRERRWSAQVREDETLQVIPAVQRDEEFPQELIEMLPEVVGNLPPGSRAVVVLHYLHELSFVETAAVLEIPLGTVKSRLAYGLASLRQQFQKQLKRSMEA
ncbi:MAG TPA: RNA polymerase sigma factor [Pyrinomonadaceae bacterium]|nr:RNA polymerase sigma factor [Pyrinomonadaceae bacterium]